MNHLLRLPEVRDAVGLKTTAIYDAIRKGSFPSPVRIGDRAVAWRESDIEAWISARPSTGTSSAHNTRSDPA